MANAFIGFPVPRAKIADMIATSAPPTLHHTNHEKNGIDEIDCTGLTGAGGGGGISLPTNEYRTYFDTLDAFSKNTANTGTITLDENGLLTLMTGTQAHSYAILERVIPYQPVKFTFNEPLSFQTYVHVHSASNVQGVVMLSVPVTEDLSHIGFRIDDGMIKGSVGNNTIETTCDLFQIDYGAYDYFCKLKCVLTPGVDCKFYIEDDLLGVIDNNYQSAFSVAFYIHPGGR